MDASVQVRGVCGIEMKMIGTVMQPPKLSDELWPKHRATYLTHATPTPSVAEMLPSLGVALHMPVVKPTPYVPVPTRHNPLVELACEASMPEQGSAGRLASENKEMRTPKPYTGRVSFLLFHIHVLRLIVSHVVEAGTQEDR